MYNAGVSDLRSRTERKADSQDACVRNSIQFVSKANNAFMIDETIVVLVAVMAKVVGIAVILAAAGR